MLFLMTLNKNHVFVNIVIILEHYLTGKNWLVGKNLLYFKTG